MSEAALFELLGRLRDADYRFIVPTPETHRKVLSPLHAHPARDLRGVFGWSLGFGEGDIDADIVELMDRAGVLTRRGPRMASRVRVASRGEHLFLHSAFPPRGQDAVFFGPDSYRFADFVAREAPTVAGGTIVDIGAGSGVGGVVAAAARPGARLILTDINLTALRLARVNAAFAGLEAETVEARDLDGVAGPIDLAVANPPYLGGSPGRAYRDGGDMLGGRLSLDWAVAAARKLAPGGRLLLYTGSAIVGGRDALGEALRTALTAEGCEVAYGEIDPDVFGGMLRHPAYRRVERIAAVGCVAVKTRRRPRRAS